MTDKPVDTFDSMPMWAQAEIVMDENNGFIPERLARRMKRAGGITLSSGMRLISLPCHSRTGDVVKTHGQMNNAKPRHARPAYFEEDVNEDELLSTTSSTKPKGSLSKMIKSPSVSRRLFTDD